jgi:hypothetical protein
MESLLNKIKEKKELQTLDDAYIKQALDSYLSKHEVKLPTDLSEKQFFKNKIVKEVISDVRKELRVVYGVFKRATAKLPKLFDEESIKNLLLAHQSSYERINLYGAIYKEIFSRIPLKKYTLLDLACGLNPLSYTKLPIQPTKCVVGDLSSSDMQLIQSFFDANKILGEAKYLDLLDDASLNQLKEKEFDVCFLFKALDSLETIKRHSSKKLLDILPVTYMVISFPLVSIGGKNSIGDNKRWWLENFCEKQGWLVESFIIENELFYIVKK